MSTQSRPKPESSPEWRDLANQASQEPDGHRVTELVREICDRLDEEEALRKRRVYTGSDEAAIERDE